MPIPQHLQGTQPTQTVKKVFQSTHLHSAEYTPDPQIPGFGLLTVRFGNGRVYQSSPYAPVPIRTWEGLRDAPSPGKYFAKYIQPFWGGLELTQAG